jgi:hypothetical protein
LCRDDHTEASQIAIAISKHAHLQRLPDGETGTRTRDTTIFSGGVTGLNRHAQGSKKAVFAGI